MSGWVTEGVQSGPITPTVLADTGELPEGGRTVTGIITATGAGVVLLQWRNSSNNGTLQEHRFDLLAGDKVILPPFYINVSADDRVRVITSGIVVGNVQASLIWS